MGGLCSTGVRPIDKKQAQEEGRPPMVNASSTTAAPAQSESSPGVKLTHNPYPADYDPPFPVQILGTFSNHGIEPDFANNAIVKANQDRGSVDHPFRGDPNKALFCCLDGHGRDGDKVSEYVIHMIHDLTAEDPSFDEDPSMGFKKAFVETDTLLRKSDINSHSSGTSAVAMYMVGQKLWIANAGDSRAVLGKKVGGKYVSEDLSWDQKPDDPGEQARIEKMGGKVTPPEAEGLSARVWTKNGRYGLSMARSIGDHLLAKNGVIADPEVQTHTINPKEDKFIILATDGVWEFIDSQEAVDIVSKHSNATEACYELMYVATKKWREEEGDYRDDITALVLTLDGIKTHMQSDPLSPSSQSRGKHNALGAFPDGTGEVKLAPSPEAATPGTVMTPVDEDKAKTFRKRRLSLNPMQADVIEAARVQHEQEAAAGGGSPPGSPGLDRADSGYIRKRRPSISPDMDPGGKSLIPGGMASMEGV